MVRTASSEKAAHADKEEGVSSLKRGRGKAGTAAQSGEIMQKHLRGCAGRGGCWYAR